MAVKHYFAGKVIDQPGVYSIPKAIQDGSTTSFMPVFFRLTPSKPKIMKIRLLNVSEAKSHSKT